MKMLCMSISWHCAGGSCTRPSEIIIKWMKEKKWYFYVLQMGEGKYATCTRLSEDQARTSEQKK